MDEQVRPMNEREKEMYEKMQEAQKAAPCGQAVVDTACCNQAPGKYRPPTLSEEESRQISYHTAEAERHAQALAFLRKNPAFDEFIRLIRSGVIQF